MRRILSFTLCLAACLLTSVSLADDTDAEKSEQKVDKNQSEKKVQSQIQSSGRIVIIGADGKINEVEFDFDGDDGKEGFDKLPKEVREKLEKLRKEIGNLEGIFGKGAIVGPQGKIKELKLDLDIDQKALKGLPKEIREKLQALQKAPIKNGAKVQAHGIIIGPDGVKKEFKFGDGKAGGDVLKDLPKEIREQIERTIKEHSNHKLTVEVLEKLQSHGEIGSPGDKKESSGVENKLDLILKRLEKMEKDIQELKKNK